MNRKISSASLVLVCLVLAFLTACDNDSDDRSRSTKTVVATSGTGQSATVNAAFAAPFVVTVTSNGSPLSGATVTFTAPSSGASGTFANSTATDTETTDSSGVATSSAFTANATAGTYTVTAVVSGASSGANFNLTNAAVVANNYSFYLSGLENVNASQGPNFYAVAGSVTIDANGNVLGGEQDYNDAFGFTSPQPSGDAITGGTLTIDETGQGTLTLITNNANFGVSGTETLGVQFANAKHALIVQFDGTATSSGSLDFQTLPSTLSGGYAFTLSGVDPGYSSVVAGGVFTISGTSLQNGIFDLDDFGAEGTPTLGTAFTGTISAPDSFGRGTITGTGLSTTFNYYIVGPEVIRIISVDAADSVIGSAFGQGTSAGNFTNASLVNSVFAVQSNSWGQLFGTVGMLNLNPCAAASCAEGNRAPTQHGSIPGNAAFFSGTADASQLGSSPFIGTFIFGDYSIASTGYGSLSITSANFMVSTFGLYMTDPTLNLNDPNNATGGGGALLADLDGFDYNGTGVVVPQTDTATASFAGNYAFGAQANVEGNFWEYDFVGQGSVTSGVLAGTGLFGDPSIYWEGGTTDSGATFSGTPLPDPNNLGRYTFSFSNSTENPLTVVAGDDTIPLNVTVYQASGGQLFWIDVDTILTYLGPLEQQGSLTGVPAVRRRATRSAKSPPKR